MKLDVTVPPKVFTPVTLTIESEAELNFFRDVIGATSVSVGRVYGLANPDLYPVYDKLDQIFAERGLEPAPKYKVTFTKL